MLDYLNRYAEPEARAPLPEGSWEAVAVLPLLGEAEAADTVASLRRAAAFAGRRLLTIAVVNSKASAPSDLQGINQKLLKDLRSLDDVLVVDRATPGRHFPEDQGVGLARKIGCDIAVALVQAGRLRCDYIHTTDGDATVDENYFSAPENSAVGGLERHAPVAVWHRYTHELQERQSLPLCLYEISLRYYVIGTRYAGSPYAFPTVGSTQAFTPEAYCQVRGFPRREAGEDFYLMNKLAKVGGVAEAPGFVRLKARPSARVPFGTGAAMRKIHAALERNEAFPLYHPDTFVWLREWLREMESFADHEDLARLQRNLPDGARKILDGLRAWDALETAVRTRPEKLSRRRHLHTWFDAFRTLKFVHAARDRHLGWLPYSEALERAPFVPHITESDPYRLLDIMRRLEAESAAAPRLPGGSGRD